MDRRIHQKPVLEKPLSIFCCYARSDQSYLYELKKRLLPLQREGLIALYADVDISAGEDWKQKIHLYLNTAHILFLLVSADFVASEYCYGIEMKQALARHERGEAVVIPIIVRPVDLRHVPFSKIQALPTDAKPITSWTDKDYAYLDVVNGIEKAIEKLLSPPQAENFPAQQEPPSLKEMPLNEQKRPTSIPSIEPTLRESAFPPAAQEFNQASASRLRVLPLLSALYSLARGTVKSRLSDASRHFVLVGLAGLVIVALSSGIVWFTFHHAPSSLRSLITEFPIPQGSPEGITRGPDGNLWFTETGNNAIGRITPNGVVTEFPIPIFGLGPEAITMGPDGNLWFTDIVGNNTTDRIGKIGCITPKGVVTEFPIPTHGVDPPEITAGGDGNLWFTESNGNDIHKIGRITPKGTITEFPISTPGSSPGAITGGPDGNLWFTERYNNTIGYITPTGKITEFPLSGDQSILEGITWGPDNNLWFTDFFGNRIGRITLTGTVTEFPIPTATSQPWAITARPDGNLWFTESAGDKIGRITPAGVFTEFPIPTPHSDPEGITIADDGHPWFIETQGNKIGYITAS